MRARSLIMVVEDNPADSHLISSSFKERHPGTEVFVIESGTSASDYLFRRNQHKDSILPDLILLDLNLPGKNGTEVLQEIKSTPHLKTIPVIMFSSSEAKTDVQACYEAGANAYFSKPNELNEFYRIIDLLHEHWLKTAKIAPLSHR